MKIRPLLYVTSFISAVLGAIVVYLALSVPNDLRADSLLKGARQDINDGNNERARDSLKRIVQQYPRTDAAAAATVALVSLAQRDRDDLVRAVKLLRTQNEQQSRMIAELQRNVTTIGSRPAQVVTVQTPAPPPPAVVKKATPKKKTPPRKNKKTPTRRRRR